MPITVAVAAAALTGCSGGVAYRAATPTTGRDVTVDIVNYRFASPDVSVPAGSTVTWLNKDDFDHTATATDRTFDTKKLAKGAASSVTFDTAGTFAYICDVHQFMAGTVVVT